MIGRREFLGAACAGALGAGSAFASPYQRAAASMHKKVKITDVKCMIVRGTWDWNLIKIETDSGLYGIGEAYWGWGVKDLVLNKLKPIIVGEDPLNVDKLYTKMLMQSAGAGAIAGVTMTAASGIEIALWDLCGRILQTPVCNLLGGRFRDRVRFYRTMQAVDNVEDPAQWRALVRSGARRKVGLDRLQIPGRRRPRQGRSRVQGTRPRPLRRALTQSRTIAASSREWRPCAKRWGPTPTSPSSATGGTTRRMSFAWAANWSPSSPCGWKIRFRPKTSKRWRASRTPSTSRSAPARIFTGARAFAS